MSFGHLADVLTKDGEVLRELDHEDNEASSSQHAGRPEQGVEDGAGAVQPTQENKALLLRGVVITPDLLLRLQLLRDVHHHGLHGRMLLLTLWDVEALQRNT